MPSSINSTTTSPGGLISTGDNSNTLLIQTGDTTAITINGSQQVALTNPLGAASGGTGLSSPGTAGNVLQSNGTSWVSAAPAPSAGSFTATASGSISAGAPVSINSDGTISSSGYVSGSNPTTYTPATISGVTRYTSAKKPGTDYLVVAELNGTQGNRLYLRLIQLSGTVATPTSFVSAALDSNAATSNYNNNPSIVYEPVSDTFVVSYVDGSAYLAVQAVRVDFNTLSFTVGTKVVLRSNPMNTCYIGYTTGGVVVAGGHEYSPSANLLAFALTVSGTTITAGSAATVSSGDAYNITFAYDSAANAFVIGAPVFNGANYIPRAVAGTISVRTITLGTLTQIDSPSTGTNSVSLNYDSSANRVVAFYYDDPADLIKARVLSVSGTTITPGSIATASGTYGNLYSSVFSIANSTSLVSTVDFASGGFRFLRATVSGTTVTFQSATTAANGYFNPFYDTQTSVMYLRNGADVIPATIAQSNTDKFAGFSSASYTNGQTATINSVGSSNTQQTGLTAGTAYILGPSGALAVGSKLSTTYVGLALSATTILVRG